ncbi:MAG: GLPGLI family protein [Chitinophagaceae bacterium]
MKKIFLFTTTLMIIVSVRSQTVFIRSGKIEFERKTNSHRLFFSGETDSWVEEFKKLVPQFRTDYFDLVFTGNKTLYKPGKEPEVEKTGFFESPAMENIVFNDFARQASVSQKKFYDAEFLLSDSTKAIKWKLEPETRTIAGFECKKAITKICDSVVVVAFYTDQIITPGGPESFNGLPGMILGLAVPRLYTTWFATKLENISPADEGKLMAPVKGKKAAAKDMINKVADVVKNWGEKYRDRSIWFITL